MADKVIQSILEDKKLSGYEKAKAIARQIKNGLTSKP